MTYKVSKPPLIMLDLWTIFLPATILAFDTVQGFSSFIFQLVFCDN